MTLARSAIYFLGFITVTACWSWLSLSLFHEVGDVSNRLDQERQRNFEQAADLGLLRKQLADLHGTFTGFEGRASEARRGAAVAARNYSASMRGVGGRLQTLWENGRRAEQRLVGHESRTSAELAMLKLMFASGGMPLGSSYQAFPFFLRAIRGGNGGGGAAAGGGGGVGGGGGAPLDGVDVTLITHLLPGQLGRLEVLDRTWNGPISASVYVCGAPARRRLASWLLSVNSRASRTAPLLDLHVVFCRNGKGGDGDRGVSRGRGPVNALRNLAIRHVRTPYVFTADVGFITSQTAYLSLLRTIRGGALERGRGGVVPKQVLVVPAFETMRAEAAVPRDKAALLALLLKANEPSIAPAALPFKYAHGPTNYTRWYSARSTYDAMYEYMYQPYVVMHRGAIPFPTRHLGEAQGHGYELAAHMYELAAGGYRITVAPDAFVVYPFQPDPVDVQPAVGVDPFVDVQGGWHAWFRFAESIFERYSFSMPLPRWARETLDGAPCLSYPKSNEQGHQHAWSSTALSHEYAGIPHDRCGGGVNGMSAVGAGGGGGVASKSQFSHGGLRREHQPLPCATPLARLACS